MCTQQEWWDAWHNEYEAEESARRMAEWLATSIPTDEIHDYVWTDDE